MITTGMVGPRFLLFRAFGNRVCFTTESSLLWSKMTKKTEDSVGGLVGGWLRQSVESSFYLVFQMASEWPIMHPFVHYDRLTCGCAKV